MKCYVQINVFNAGNQRDERGTPVHQHNHNDMQPVGLRGGHITMFIRILHSNLHSCDSHKVHYIFSNFKSN